MTDWDKERLLLEILSQYRPAYIAVDIAHSCNGAHFDIIGTAVRAFEVNVAVLCQKVTETFDILSLLRREDQLQQFILFGRIQFTNIK